MTFDLVLIYHDNPMALDRFFARLYQQTDFLSFGDRANFLICDTGTPREKLTATLEVCRRWQSRKRPILVRAETTAIRQSFPPDVDVRTVPLAANIAVLDVSKADVVVHAILSNLFVPAYFTEVMALHAQDPRLFVQPFQYRLVIADGQDSDTVRPLGETLAAGKMEPAGGLPDFSVRREHIAAIGGWDEEFLPWGMCDIDLCSRLTGKIDLGVPAEQWHQGWCGRPKEPYQNYGLTFVRPLKPDFCSLISHEYIGRAPQNSIGRQNALRFTLKRYVDMWSVVQRNAIRRSVNYEVYREF